MDDAPDDGRAPAAVTVEALSKDQILAAGAPRVVEVDVPAWGKVKLRELSIADVATLNTGDDAGGAASSRLVAASIMNGKGGPMFTVDEISRLAAGRLKPTLAALVAEIDKLNGLSAAQQEAIAKN